MSSKYKLGDYEFDTYEEYLEGQEDLQKIDVITSEMDVTDIYIALGLYERVRNKEIVFKTQVGTGFFMYLADIVVSGSKELLEEKKRLQQRKANRNRVSLAYRLAGAALIAIAVGAFGYIYYDTYRENQSAQAMARVMDIQNMTGSNIEQDVSSDDAVADNTAQLEAIRTALEAQNAAQRRSTLRQAAEELTVLPEYEELYEENPDFIGWLSIEGTSIDYPVLQSVEDNGQFYLTHSFFKENDKNGSLFLDYRNDIIDRSTNLIIYGHNMKSGAMFGTLKNFLNADYINQHPTIEFNTLYEKGTYEVIGAGLSEVSYDDEYTFRYYNFLDAANEDEMQAFKVNMTQLLATDKHMFDVDFGDDLLTLSTCSSYTEEGRMFVIAKKV